MVLDLLKWLKETIIYEKKERNHYKNMNFCNKKKVHIKKKERAYEFFGFRKSWYYEFLGVKAYIFFNAENWKEVYLSLVFTKFAWCYKKWERWSFSSSKSDKMIFSSIWNTTFTGYWKVLVLKFSEVENTVFFRAKKFMEIWYL